MIHIVSGFMRSGTSMMMEALIAGGMDADWSKDRNKVADKCADANYHPNENGLYEIDLKEYEQVDFPLKHDGKLIKVMLWGLDNLAVDEYRVIIMKRDPEEIRQSFEAFTGRKFDHPWLKEYESRIERSFDMLRNRADIHSVLVVDYRRMLDNPEFNFSKIAGLGWPVDHFKAAAAIDPKKCRFKIESLTVGL